MVPKTFVIIFLYFFCLVTKVILASKYTVMTQDVSYFDAALTCKVAGMDLVSIETLDEWQDIVDLVTSLGYGNGTKYFWTSGNSLSKPHSRNFSWMSDGSLIPRDELFWHKGQPDNANTTTSYDEQCVHITWRKTNNTYTPGLNDVNCNFKYDFICERPEKCQNESTFPASKYEVRIQEVNYFDAVLSCKQSGKDLVSVETLDEWQEIVRFLKNSGHVNKNYGSLFWTSGNSLDEPHSKNFHWMSDGSLIPRCKLFWAETEPNNLNHNEQCVDIQNYDTLGFNDNNCDSKLFGFICEDRAN